MVLRLPPMEGFGTTVRVKNGLPLAGHGAQAVRDAIAAKITALPEHLRKTLTWDQGAETAQHAQLRIDAGMEIHFCDPHSPWLRGTDENTNGLLRQYFPQGDRPGPLRRARARRGRCHPQQPAPQDTRMEDTNRGTR